MTQETRQSAPGIEAVLFPHVALGERDLKRALALFDRITVCRPWYLEVPSVALERPPWVDIRHPPEALRPPSDFKRILAEHRRWMSEHHDRGLSAFLAALGNGFEDPESTWEIRKGIRAGGNPPPPASREEKALEWHLLLHLSYELERARVETDEAIRALRRLESPLKEALGEDAEAPDMLEDLHGPESDLSFEEGRLLQITNAWLGLFGGQLERAPFALTFHPELPALVSEGIEAKGEAHFLLPDPAHLDAEDFLSSREGLGRGGREAVAALSAVLRREPPPAPEEIREACRHLESRLGAMEPGHRSIAVTLYALHPDAVAKEGGPAPSLAGRFARKAILLLEETEGDG